MPEILGPSYSRSVRGYHGNWRQCTPQLVDTRVVAHAVAMGRTAHHGVDWRRPDGLEALRGRHSRPVGGHRGSLQRDDAVGRRPGPARQGHPSREQEHVLRWKGCEEEQVQTHGGLRSGKGPAEQVDARAVRAPGPGRLLLSRGHVPLRPPAPQVQHKAVQEAARGAPVRADLQAERREADIQDHRQHDMRRHCQLQGVNKTCQGIQTLAHACGSAPARGATNSYDHWQFVRC
mmetsp:Transcript_41636/g.110489  ORF Transcript_41636/g.110489 Transcript_41636/m.110489 type:complete len:233 (+) Transcript_41636:586-1284(+)